MPAWKLHWTQDRRQSQSLPLCFRVYGEISLPWLHIIARMLAAQRVPPDLPELLDDPHAIPSLFVVKKKEAQPEMGHASWSPWSSTFTADCFQPSTKSILARMREIICKSFAIFFSRTAAPPNT